MRGPRKLHAIHSASSCPRRPKCRGGQWLSRSRQAVETPQLGPRSQGHRQWNGGNRARSPVLPKTTPVGALSALLRHPSVRPGSPSAEIMVKDDHVAVRLLGRWWARLALSARWGISGEVLMKTARERRGDDVDDMCANGG